MHRSIVVSNPVGIHHVALICASLVDLVYADNTLHIRNAYPGAKSCN